MIGPSGTVRVMVATKPVDFRKGMEGLAMLVREHMKADPFSGAVYVFRAKRADRIKLIFWDGTVLGLSPSGSKKASSAGRRSRMRDAVRRNSALSTIRVTHRPASKQLTAPRRFAGRAKDRRRNELGEESASPRLNYGADRIRYLSPVPAGSRLRGRASIAEAEDVPPNGLRVHYHVMIEIEGGKPPACVAGVIGLHYRRNGAKPALQSMM